MPYTLEEAVAKILAAVPPPVAESAPLAQAHRRILAEKISAPISLPLFDNSSMDGYAVRAEDTALAASQKPVRLKLAGRVAAGQTFEADLRAGECVRIFTGSPLPKGADAVVMQEDTRAADGNSDGIVILEPVARRENVRFRGEDVKQGATLVEAGEALAAGKIALLAACGITRVSVGRSPRVALLATGSELREASGAADLAPGQIFESNRVALAALVEAAGSACKILPLVPDEPEATRAALDRAFAECDVVLTCGGVSVGELDFVKSAFEQSGGALEFWKVDIKPGKPFVFGRRGEKTLFGLPGNPVSAFVTFLLLVRPALLRWQGAKDVSLPSHPGVLAEPLMNSGSRPHFVRVIVDSSGQVRSAGVQASHILSSMAAANGLVEVSPQTNLAAGSAVKVLRWD